MPPVLTLPLSFLPGQSPVRKRANVKLELRTRSGSWESVEFRVDTGAELTGMSLRLTEPPSITNPWGLDLATPLEERRVEKKLADGSSRWVKMQLGVLTARFPVLPDSVFKWECLFDPTVEPDGPRLLGIGGRVLSDVHITFRGASREYVDGSVEFEILVPPTPAQPTLPPPPSP